MPARFRHARVVRIVEETPHSQVVEIRIEDPEEPGPTRAFHETGLLGPLRSGDRVVVNTTARRLGLGTGGVDFVVWRVDRLPPDPPPAGHLMKLRYTPLQRPVLAVEEPGHPLRETYLDAEASGLGGCPVVALELHSQLAAAAAGARAAGARRIAFLQTEAGALPASFSRLLPELRRLGWIHAVVTAGHAYGGDLEAVSCPSGLLAAAAAGADVILAGPGPGIAGTGTRYGHSAVEQARVLDAAGALGGRPVACLRLSALDPRARHRPISHHTLTALELARASAWLPVPAASASGGRCAADPEEGVEAVIAAARRRLFAWPAVARHSPIDVDAAPALQVLAGANLGVRSMGRPLQDDPVALMAAGAAGIWAGTLSRTRSA